MESDIEAYLRKEVARLGGMHRKVTYQGRSGSPDDWCFFPGGALLIVECKAPKKSPRPDQAHEIKILQKMGQKVFVVRSKEDIDKMLEEHRENSV